MNYKYERKEKRVRNRSGKVTESLLGVDISFIIKRIIIGVKVVHQLIYPEDFYMY